MAQRRIPAILSLQKQTKNIDQIVLFLFMNAACLLCQKLYFIFAYILTVTNSNKLLRQPFAQAPPTMTRFSGTLFTLAGTGMSVHAGNILAMNTYKFTEFGCYEVKIEEKD